MIDFAGILRTAGCHVVEVPGWQTRGHPGVLTPVGILVHHTGGDTNDLPGLLTRGRPDLPGPIANLGLDKNGVFSVVAAGVAWHAGTGSGFVLRQTAEGMPPVADAATRHLVDDANGNGQLIGIEVENRGDGHDPYPQTQLDALVAGCAALSRYATWSASHTIAHREFTRRKIDPTLDMGWLRAAVNTHLTGTPAPTPTGDDEVDAQQAEDIAEAAGARTWGDTAPKSTKGLEVYQRTVATSERVVWLERAVLAIAEHLNVTLPKAP